jgi:hypothetical protein
MTEQCQSHFDITAADLRRYGWQSIAEQHPEKECRGFMGAFEIAAKEQEAKGDERGRKVFSVLPQNLWVDFRTWRPEQLPGQ